MIQIKGIERHYELGKWFRNRYTGFLSEEYSPNDIRVVSTDVDRTLMSAASNLAGLYPPPDSQIWNDDLLWEPIPIHTTASENDEILYMGKECPKYIKLHDEFTSSDYFKNISIENKDLFEYISNHTGWNVTTLDEIGFLYSIFYIYQNYNASYIPAWANNLDQEKFNYLAGLSFASLTFTDDLKRLRVGPFLNYLTNYFENVVENVTDTPKFLMLSAHDITLSSVLNGMGAYDNWPPEYASTIIWELRRNNSGMYYINLLYKKNSTNILEKLTVNGCTFNCAFDDFKINLKSIIVNTTDWEEECLKINHATKFKSYWTLMLLVKVILFCFT
ncbi:hypothetical protein NQ314_001571 [Rhamnusium bicolor]|uniref:acid phosphatase n=1 Tax=Rhamnusium bicolor TaxID=1586634 RepID=A0AAV8ZRV0_9CUCU|nr:hypothetical protein NQ314_001571 [Rhamnusium bicolor]